MTSSELSLEFENWNLYLTSSCKQQKKVEKASIFENTPADRFSSYDGTIS